MQKCQICASEFDPLQTFTFRGPWHCSETLNKKKYIGSKVLRIKFQGRSILWSKSQTFQRLPIFGAPIGWPEIKTLHNIKCSQNSSWGGGGLFYITMQNSKKLFLFGWYLLFKPQYFRQPTKKYQSIDFSALALRFPKRYVTLLQDIDFLETGHFLPLAAPLRLADLTLPPKNYLYQSWTGPENFIKIFSFHPKLFNFFQKTDRHMPSHS